MLPLWKVEVERLLGFRSMIDGVVSLVVGLVGLLLWFQFKASANLDIIDDMTLMIVNVVGVFLGLALLYGAIRLISKGSSNSSL